MFLFRFKSVSIAINPITMKLQFLILFVLGSCFYGYGQDQVLFDLDTYKRVDFNYRSTFISPDAYIDYTKSVNTPGQEKRYGIRFGGKYDDEQIINNENIQKTKDRYVDFNIKSGSTEEFDIDFLVANDTRKYAGMKYFLSGMEYKNTYVDRYYELSSGDRRADISHELNYSLGFGFGRLEVVDNAWLGARVLQELNAKKLLLEIPETSELKLFFDLIGDLEFERVRDPRLKSIYVLENVIKYIEAKGWVEEGSIPAFVSISDSYRFEDFFRRYSGKRLEFRLTPRVSGLYRWSEFGTISNRNYLQGGFVGNVEYTIHSNGDLKYYTSKVLGGRIANDRRYHKNANRDETFIYGEIYFEYDYRYIISQRTNLLIASDIKGAFQKSDNFDATFLGNVRMAYFYYLTPATQLKLAGRFSYSDGEFQIGDYQPQIFSFFSIDVVHAFR